MSRYKRYSVPAEAFKIDGPNVRPDGKHCTNMVTDQSLITLMWSGSDGVRIASFYEGCDPREFEPFYKSVLAVSDPLPIQQIIGQR